jgi:predicted RNase H-like nuclease
VSEQAIPRAVAGVDGCKAGWVAVCRAPDEQTVVKVFPTFADLVAALSSDAAIAVDMPIGLPAFSSRGGRGPEALVRPLLGQRQSSVFSIPSRAALYARTDRFTTLDAWYEAHRVASVVARATSSPPRGVSIQAFGIFSKIRELDALLIARPELRTRVIESHPEVAFWQLNGRRAMELPKKVKGRVNAPGMEERKALLARHGLARGFLDQAPPRGAAEDDFLDAAAVMLVAARFARGEAICFPDPPGMDDHGLPVTIWA